MSNPTAAPAEDTAAAAPATKATPASTNLLDRAKRKSSGAARAGGEAWVFSARDEVAELLEGSTFEVDSYLQNAYRQIKESKMLTDAVNQSPSTVMGGIMLGATLQLPIGGPLGQFYLTPRNEGRDENRRVVCVPMIGYRGFFELGYRSGLIRSFDYIVRRAGDTFKQGGNSAKGKWFEWEQFENGEHDELDENGELRPLTGVVALAHRFGADEPAWQFMSKSTIEKRKPRTTRNTPWEGQHFEAMYIKTPHRELAKFQQLTIASARAVAADETISLWNRTTGALQTLAPEQDAPHELEAGGIGADPGPAGSPDTNSPAAGVSAPEPPEAADGRRAPQSSDGIDALDLPAFAKEQGRSMTEAEYERYSGAGGE